MNIELTAHEARVIACLIEKEITTPEQYPLSLNALVNACNQKSNRDPVLNLDESAVQSVLDGLIKKYFVNQQSGSRVAKYQHRFCNTTYGVLKFSPSELAVICELLLRGPQTPGELRSRASRMFAFSDVSQIDATLSALADRADGPFVIRLAREPGRRESRYSHTLGDSDALDGLLSVDAVDIGVSNELVTQLRARVAELERELAELKAVHCGDE